MHLSLFYYLLILFYICRNIDGCCFGYFWNSKANTCERQLKLIIFLWLLIEKTIYMHTKLVVLFISVCMPGYIGLNCTTHCPYPSYGERCQGYCNCENDTCDVSTGCKHLMTGICLSIKYYLVIKVLIFQFLTDKLRHSLTMY